ncbi:ERF family protein [Neglectibacter timonensis]|jgi:hypothetical protein|uniref:ERF family protein n=1 Tax=Neglectibacter timonensis TaxID=1776382 RepID=UPI0039952A6A
MAEQNLNIYQKLAKIRKQVEVIQRNKKGYGYTYVSEDEILAKISGFMDKYSLSLIPSVIHSSAVVTPYHTKKTKSTNKGEIYEENVNEVLVSADMVFTWVNNENPNERVDVPWILVGHQSDGSQSFGSGLSYAMRYFLLKFFNIATPDDDPDKWRSKQKAAGAAEDKMIAEEIIASFDTMVKEFLASNQDKTEEVKKFVAKYVKGGNYFAITESVLASKLLADFKETFKIKE